MEVRVLIGHWLRGRGNGLYGRAVAQLLEDRGQVRLRRLEGLLRELDRPAVHVVEVEREGERGRKQRKVVPSRPNWSRR